MNSKEKLETLALGDKPFEIKVCPASKRIKHLETELKPVYYCRPLMDIPGCDGMIIYNNDNGKEFCPHIWKYLKEGFPNIKVVV
ncbi:MAG: hypothetical protein PHW96_00775 [Candidatus Nanoarchaeia archaeon]|nr:hypothetical protein [Candidatus Nanoarchaeia archaeon]